MILLYTTSLPIDNPYAVAADIGIGIKPIPVKLNIIELLDVVAMTTNVTNDFNIVVSVLFSSLFFGFLVFVFEVCNQLFNIVNWVVEAFHIVQFLF